MADDTNTNAQPAAGDDNGSTDANTDVDPKGSPLSMGDDTGGDDGGKGGDPKPNPKDGDNKDAGGKSGGDGEKPKPGDADEFQLTLPDGVEVDEVAVKAFTDLAKEAGVTGEQASKFVAFDHARKQAEVDAAVKADESRIDGWVKDLDADVDFGGDKLKATHIEARRAFRAFGDKSLADELNALGVDNHPGLIKMVARMGRTMSEDGVGGKNPGKDPKLTRAQEDAKFYNNSQPDAD